MQATESAVDPGCNVALKKCFIIKIQRKHVLQVVNLALDTHITSFPQNAIELTQRADYRV